jgi:hypothetical protein
VHAVFRRPGALLVAATSLLLLLCATTGCTYQSINPEASLADKRANNGYHELRDVEPSATKIVLRSAGTAFPVRFSVAADAQSCKLTPLGNVSYTGRGIVYPWIANMLQRKNGTQPFLVHEPEPGKPIQVRGYGSWADGSGVSYRSGHCGPVYAEFTPQAGHAYTVDFLWGNNPACSLVVNDASDPDAPVPVATLPALLCMLQELQAGQSSGQSSQAH